MRVGTARCVGKFGRAAGGLPNPFLVRVLRCACCEHDAARCLHRCLWLRSMPHARTANDPVCVQILPREMINRLTSSISVLLYARSLRLFAGVAVVHWNLKMPTAGKCDSLDLSLSLL